MPPEELTTNDQQSPPSIDSASRSPPPQQPKPPSTEVGGVPLGANDDPQLVEEAMLDFFPLNCHELMVVRQGFKRYQEATASKDGDGDDCSQKTTLQTIFVEILGNENGDDDEEELEKQQQQQLETADEHRQRLVWTEEEFFPEAGSLLTYSIENVFLIGSGHDNSKEYRFVEAVVTLLGRRGLRGLLQVIFQAAASTAVSDASTTTALSTEPTPAPTTVRAEVLVDLVYRLLVAAQYLQYGIPTVRRPYPKSWARSMAARVSGSSAIAMFSTETTPDAPPPVMVSLPAWIDWTDSVAPQAYQTLSTFCHVALFGPYHPPRPALIVFPNIVSGRDGSAMECAFWTFPFQSIPASLALLSPSLGGDWVPLYSSDYDGFNFRALQDHLLAYHGSTVLLVQTKAGDSFGYYTDCPWKESKHWYGPNEEDNGESFLFGLKPSMQYYGVEGEKHFHMFLNNPVYPHPGDIAGLAVGGITDKTPRVLITPSFENCKAGSMDGVYANGPLLSNGELFFDVEVIEAFAVNCSHYDYEKAVKEGKARAAVREGTRIKAAQVDRRQFLEDFKSGDYMNHLYQHRDQVRGRHSFVAHDDDDSGYYVHGKEPSRRAIFGNDDDALENTDPS